MKRKIKHVEKCRKAFEIEVPSEEVTKKIDALYEKISKTATIPGFRPGKAPRDLLVKHYGDRVTKEVIEDIIADAYHKSLKEEAFSPLGLPEISDVKLDDKKTLFFKAEFNVRPTIELKNYRKLTLTRKKAEVKDEDIEKSIKALQESSAKFNNAQGRPVKIGDYIICDSEVFVDGKSIVKKRENIWMPVEEKSYIPGLSAQLAGANCGDEKEIETVLPAEFQTKEYANKKAVFKIKIKEIKEKVLAQIDDELAKDLGYNNLAELRDAVRKLLEGQAEQASRQDLEQQALKRLLESLSFEVPNSLVERQLEYLVEDEKKKLLRQGIKQEQITAKDKELADKLRPVSQSQVKTMFILDEIANKEGIEVSKEEIDQALEVIARQSNQPRQDVEKYYNDHDLMTSLRADLRQGKVMEFLIKEANVIEEGGKK